MFDAIARRYDLLNHVLSAGLDVRWRARAIRERSCAPNARVLDLCTGTADFAIAALHAAPGARVVGVDFAGAMLRVGLDKLRGRALDRQITLVRGDATRDPGARRLGRRGHHRVRHPQRRASRTRRSRSWRASSSRAAASSSSSSASRSFRGSAALYNWYFRVVLPQLGRLVSKHQSAYSYLPASVGTFPAPPRLRRHHFFTRFYRRPAPSL